MYEYEEERERERQFFQFQFFSLIVGAVLYLSIDRSNNRSIDWETQKKTNSKNEMCFNFRKKWKITTNKKIGAKLDDDVMRIDKFLVETVSYRQWHYYYEIHDPRGHK